MGKGSIFDLEDLGRGFLYTVQTYYNGSTLYIYTVHLHCTSTHVLQWLEGDEVVDAVNELGAEMSPDLRVTGRCFK